MRISINPHQALEIQSFEEFRTVNVAVEQFNGEDHPLTAQLRQVGWEHYDFRNGRFTPNVIKDSDNQEFASIAFSALEKIASSSDTRFGPVAAFMLEHAEVVVNPISSAEITDPVPAFRDPPVRDR